MPAKKRLDGSGQTDPESHLRLIVSSRREASPPVNTKVQTLRSRREQLGINTTDLASVLQIAESSVRNYEAHKSHPSLSLEQLDRWSRVLSCSFEELCHLGDYERNPVPIREGSSAGIASEGTLKGRRLELNLSPAEVCAALEIAPSSLRNYEAGAPISLRPDKILTWLALYDLGFYEFWNVVSGRGVSRSGRSVYIASMTNHPGLLKLGTAASPIARADAEYEQILYSAELHDKQAAGEVEAVVKDLTSCWAEIPVRLATWAGRTELRRMPEGVLRACFEAVGADYSALPLKEFRQKYGRRHR